jgi:hypothetical protein
MVEKIVLLAEFRFWVFEIEEFEFETRKNIKKNYLTASPFYF